MRTLIRARNRTVAVDGAHIVEPDGRFDAVLEFRGADVVPGLINAHDHLHRNHYGRLGRPPYRNAYEWARDIQIHERPRIAEGRLRPRREALLAGAWKNLFCGATTVVHHDPWEADFDHRFPIRVARVACADSLGMTPELPPPGIGPFCLHLGEGIDAEAAEEVRTLAALGRLDAHLIAAHGVGVDADGIGRLRAARAALAWCPSSNLFLFGRTAPPELLDGIDVLIGSDSRLTGEGDLLDELRCARACGLVEDERLLNGVGVVAAHRLGLPPPSLSPGAPADLAVFARPPLDASADDVLFVMVGGAPRVARPDVGGRLEPLFGEGEAMEIGSVARWTNARSPMPDWRSLL